MSQPPADEGPDTGPLSFSIPEGIAEDFDDADFDAMTVEDPVGASLSHEDLVDFVPGPLSFGGPELTWEDTVTPGTVQSPNYRHLGEHFSAVPFTLDASVLETLAEVNHFEEGLDTWGGDLVIFGLRGCRIASGDDLTPGFVDSVQLAEDQLDHIGHHCVLGVWNRATGQVAAFTSNTIPSWHYLAKGIAARTANPKASGGCSCLMPGLYRYKVGPHPSSGKYHLDALRIQDGDYLVWRPAPGRENISVEVTDSVDGPSHFGHNIHPSWTSKSKLARHIHHGSAGCQTFPGGGSPSNGNKNWGVWLEFRRALGLPDIGSTAKVGQPHSYMLLTGREARMAARGDGWRLERVRHGSRGDKVRAAQRALGLPETGVANGALIRKAVVRFWADKTETADPVIGPWEATVLGLSIGDSGVV